MVEPDGFVPTEWMPISMAFLPSARWEALRGDGEGQGNRAKQLCAARTDEPRWRRCCIGRSTYIGTLLYGSLASIEEAEIDKNLPQWTDEVLQSNRMKARQRRFAFAGGARAGSST